MNTDERQNKYCSQRHKGSVSILRSSFLLLAGVIVHHVAWADISQQNHMMGKPVIWQQIVPVVLTPAIPLRQVPNFKNEIASIPTRQVVNWIVHSGDNDGQPFMIVDKAQAQVFMFDAKGMLSGKASALLGLAVGDDSTPNIGKRMLSSILPSERTTPAGRFVASLGHSMNGNEILWVDYETAISLHRIIAGTETERRAERMASALTTDKRISYGCINVPVAFFEDVVLQAFTGTSGVVYILPETRDIQSTFGSYYDFEAR